MVIRKPEQRLIYLHCSSIFHGANAEIRRPGKIIRMLSQHKASIKTLTQEFTLDAIAAVAKQLLDDNVFGSQSRARLRFPELFETSKTREAERKASEANVAKFEAEAIHENLVTSDEEWEEEVVENCTSQGQRVIPFVQRQSVDQNSYRDFTAADSKSSIDAQGLDTRFIPPYHPLYLPFKTQHQTLALLQSMLEESCFEFGKAWVPELMQEQNWEEAECIELTQWINRFSKYATNLPAEAINCPGDKSLMQILSATSSLRHSAVHRLSTSAAGILKMIDAAISFTEALKDKKRFLRIQEIKGRLTNTIEDIVQHQTVLEHKLSDQLSDLARKRAELDEQERLAKEDVLSDEKAYRASAASAVNHFLATFRPTFCNCTPEWETTQSDPKGDYNSDEDDDNQESLMDQGHQNFIRIPASAGLTSKDQRSPVDVFVNEDVHPRNGPANGSVETAPLPVNEETEPINPSSRTGKPEKKPNCNEAIVTVEPVVPTVAHCDMKLGSAAVNPLLMPNAVVTEDVASVAVEERAPRRPAHLSQEEPPNQSSAVRSYDIRIKILHGTETTKSMVSLDSITKSAIFDKAHSIYSQVACQHNPEQTGWKQESKFQLLSVEVDGLFVDLSKFDSEDLTFWIQTIFEDGASHVHG